MACNKYPDHPIEYFLDFKWIEGTTCYYGDQLGVQVFFLIFFGVTFLALYNTSDSVLLPMVVVIVLAPILATLLPGIGLQFVLTILLLTLAIAGFSLYQQAGTI
jgi:hypothetical protein